MNPWDWNAKQITRLSDRIDVLPSVREASVTGLSPLTVTFDTDTTGTVVFGTLAAGLREGDRVLTVRLARYVWVLGARNGGDTGWVDLSSYFLDASVEGRRDGVEIEIRGTIQTDIATGTGLTAVHATALPGEWRPTGLAAYGTAYSGGMALAVRVNTAGSVELSNRNAVNIAGAIPFTIKFKSG